jgi:hypothetical protein
MRSSFVRKSAAFEFAGVGLGEAIGIGDCIEPDPDIEQAARRTAARVRIRINLKPAPW